MNKRAEIYENYLKKFEIEHPNIEKPNVYGGCGGINLSIDKLDTKGAIKLNTMAFKTMNNNPKDKIIETPDGRIIEMGFTTSGVFKLAYEFSCRKSWESYREPMSRRVYFEEW